jgi:hypothetical protein
MMADGEIDFSKAQIRPALHMIPLCFQPAAKETTSITLVNDRMVPDKGNRILCRKLPRIISVAAQKLAITEAFSHLLPGTAEAIVLMAIGVFYQSWSTKILKRLMPQIGGFREKQFLSCQAEIMQFYSFSPFQFIFIREASLFPG